MGKKPATTSTPLKGKGPQGKVVQLEAATPSQKRKADVANEASAKKLEAGRKKARLGHPRQDKSHKQKHIHI